MVELIKPEFIFGDEKKFADFISSLSNAKKIICVSHTDLDGIASARVVDYALQVDKVIIANYIDFNGEFAKKLEKENASHVIFSDLILEKEFILKCEKFADILIIDHHIPKEDLNSDKTLFMNSSTSGLCAAYICYYLFSKIKDLKEIDWLVACACVSDFCYKTNWEWINSVYNKHGEEFKGGLLEKATSGKFWDIQWKINLASIYYSEKVKKVYDLIGNKFGEIRDLDKCAEEVQKDFDNTLKRFHEEKIEFSGGYLWEVYTKFPIKSLLINWLSVEEPNKILIFARKDNGVYHFSARRQDGAVNVKDFLQNLVRRFNDGGAGGHFKAAGGHIDEKDEPEFIRRLKEL